MNEAQQKLEEAMAALKQAKSTERTAKDRYIAVTITELEKVIAYIEKYVLKE